jgi:hypothetical protein
MCALARRYPFTRYDELRNAESERLASHLRSHQLTHSRKAAPRHFHRNVIGPIRGGVELVPPESGFLPKIACDRGTDPRGSARPSYPE